MRLAPTLIGPTAATLLAALPFAASGATSQTPPSASVLLYSDPELPVAFREALGTALCQLTGEVLAIPTRDAPLESGQILVRFTPTTFNQTVIGGFLSWEDAEGNGAAGPTLGLSAMDREIDDDLLRQFATDLSHSIDLPLQ